MLGFYKYPSYLSIMINKNDMNMTELQIAQVSNRGNKFAVIAGKSILAKFKSFGEAVASLSEKRDLYEFWAGSASVSVDNSEWKILS